MSRKTIYRAIAVLSLMMLAVSALAQQSRSRWPIQPPGRQNTISTIASFPSGTILENIAIAPTGDLFVTAVDSGAIFRVSRSGKSQIFAQIEGPLVGLAFDVDGTLVASSQTSVYRFSHDGKPSLVIDINGAQSLNGVCLLSPGTFLVADDTADVVWKVDVKKRSASVWLSGNLLVHPSDFPIGPNGIKIFRGAAYISNTGAGTLIRVPVRHDGSAGLPEVYASSLFLDDFAFGLDGSVFGATQLGTIIHLYPNGKRTTIATGTLGDAAVAFGRTLFDLRDIYVVNNGGVFLDLPEGPEPATIIRIVTNMVGYPVGN